MSLPDFLLLFFSGLLIIFFFWLAGRIILLVFDWVLPESIQTACVSIVGGLTFITIVYSLIRSSQFRTLSVVIILVGALWVFLRKKSTRKFVRMPLQSDLIKLKNELREVALLSFFFLLVFVSQWIKMDAFGNQVVPFGAEDFPIYITISEQLNLQGVENSLSYLNVIQGVSISTAQPYHFFDLWFNAFLQWVVPSNHISVYLFVFIPVFVFCGFLMLVNIGSYCTALLGKKNDAPWTWKLTILAFLFLFLIGYIPYSSIGHGGFEFLSAPLFNNHKFYYSYFLIGMSVPFLATRSYLNVSFILLVTCYFFILYLPIAATIMLLIVVTEIVRRGLRNLSIDLIYSLLLFGLGVILIGLFYYCQPHEGQLTEMTSIDFSQLMRSSLKNFFSAKALYNFFRASAPKVIYFIPFLLALAGLLKSKSDRIHIAKVLILTFTLILIGGLWSFAFIFHVEGWQFLSQTYCAGLYVIFFVGILWLLTKSKSLFPKIVLVLVAAQFGLSIVKTMELDSEYPFLVSASFKEQIIKNRSRFSPLGLYLITHKEFDNSSRNVSPYLNYYAGFVKFVPDTWLIQASNIDSKVVDKMSQEFKTLYLTSPIIRLAKERNLSFENAVLEFVRSNKISYVVWSDPRDLNYLSNQIAYTISDQKSGFNISFLKQVD